MVLSVVQNDHSWSKYRLSQHRVSRPSKIPSSSSSTWPEMSNKSNPVSLLPHLVYIYIYISGIFPNQFISEK